MKLKSNIELETQVSYLSRVNNPGQEDWLVKTKI